MSTSRQLPPDFLAGVRLFEGLDRAALEEASALGLEIARDTGAAFFSQEDRAHRWYVLASGHVRLAQVTAEGHQITVRYVAPGDVFGCVPLFGGISYPATAVAVTRSSALSWDRPGTEALMHRWPTLAMRALSMVGNELEAMRERYRELATERVEQRLARSLLRLVRDAGTECAEGLAIEMPLSRQDLAELAGTTLHTASRIMSAWEGLGVVVSGRSRVTVRDVHALTALAGETS
jgi:CRP-like cAMP-binding protein